MSRTHRRSGLGRWSSLAVAIVMVTSGAAAASAGDPEPTAPTPDVVEATEGSTTLLAPLEEEATDPAADTTSPEEPAPSPEEAAPPAQPEGEGEGVPTPSEPEGGTPVEAQPAPVVAPAAHDDEDEDHDHDGGHDTAVVLVNGQPFRGQGDPKLEGCSITLSIAELEDGAHGVAGSIRAVDPSGDADLVEFETGFSGPSWTQTWELDDLVDGLDRKPNGYRIQISLAIDEGDTLVSRRFWLACGAPQTGSPYVIVIDKQWIDPEGAPLPGPPAELPADWRITASSQLGSALCVYPEGSDELTCEYDNKGGHGGSDDGLRVPGGKDKTFTVEESVLPDGWSNVSGIGTFKPREVCPGHGGGHDDDGHDDDHDGGHGTSSAALAAEDEGEGGREPCAHLVVNQQAPTPTIPTTIPTTTPTTAPAPSPTDPPGSDVRDAGADQSPDPVPTGTGTLARTGSDPMPLALVGLGALLLGSAALGARRQRLSRT